MKKSEKKQILDLLQTINEAIVYLSLSPVSDEVRAQLTEDFKSSFLIILSKIDSSDPIQKSIYKNAISIQHDLESMEYSEKHLTEKISALYAGVEVQIIPPTEVLFLPYKYSMWDCMESIWQAAKEDPSCNCEVMPLPYYDKKADGSFGNYYYEGGDFPMEILSYNEYNLENECPDVIYIHNPYDDSNLVTSIPPAYYSEELKKYTKMLVYVPYYIENHTQSYEKFHDLYRTKGYKFADRIIVQSEITKNIYVAKGIPAEKLLVLGNPKIDAVLQKSSENKYTEKWDYKLSGKKVILINSSIATFLEKPDWLLVVKSIIQTIDGSESIGAIWRPHPLLLNTIINIYPQQLAQYGEILDIIHLSPNIVKDADSDMYPAIRKADGMISDDSSLVQLFTFTGKPVYSLVHSKDRRKDSFVFCDYFSNYFLEDGDRLEDFMKNVLLNHDDRKEERMRMIRNSVVNAEGSCGRKVHAVIKAEIHCI